MRFRLSVSFVALFLFTATPVGAVDNDGQVWLAGFARAPLGDDWFLHFEAQGRYGEDAGRLSQTLLRTGIGYQPSERLSLLAGYAYISTDRNNADDVEENRIYQEVFYRPSATLGGWRMALRTRFEQRFVETGDDVGFRVRQFVRASRPVRDGSKIDIVGSAAVFIALNDTDWGARSGFDQSRIFGGVNFPVTKRLRAETGYLNQYISRAGEDRMNHIALFSLSAAL